VVTFQGDWGPGISREGNRSTLGGEGLAERASAGSSITAVDGDGVTTFHHSNILVLQRPIQARLFSRNNPRKPISDFNGEWDWALACRCRSRSGRGRVTHPLVDRPETIVLGSRRSNVGIL
jgi:hypothetical protein